MMERRLATACLRQQDSEKRNGLQANEFHERRFLDLLGSQLFGPDDIGQIKPYFNIVLTKNV